MDWWKVVQEYFLGIQKPFPAIRKKAISEDLDQLKSQIVGVASSMAALTLDKYRFDYDETINVDTCVAVLEAYEKGGHEKDHFKKLIHKKRAKYLRRREKERSKINK